MNDPRLIYGTPQGRVQAFARWVLRHRRACDDAICYQEGRHDAHKGAVAACRGLEDMIIMNAPQYGGIEIFVENFGIKLEFHKCKTCFDIGYMGYGCPTCNETCHISCVCTRDVPCTCAWHDWQSFVAGRITKLNEKRP